MQFHERLQKLREQAGFSNAKAFAKALHIPYTTYQNYEAGISEPKASTLVRMANTLHTSIDKLVGHRPPTPDEFEKAAALFHEATGGTATLEQEEVHLTSPLSKQKWEWPISKNAFIQAINDCLETFNRDVRPRLIKDMLISKIDEAYREEHWFLIGKNTIAEALHTISKRDYFAGTGNINDAIKLKPEQSDIQPLSDDEVTRLVVKAIQEQAKKIQNDQSPTPFLGHDPFPTSKEPDKTDSPHADQANKKTADPKASGKQKKD